MAEAPTLDATFNAFKQRGKRFVLTRAAIGYCLAALAFTAAYLAASWSLWSDVFAWYFEVIASMEDRVVKHRRDERGSVTIEQVIWAGAVIVIVAIVVAAIKAFVTSESAKIK